MADNITVNCAACGYSFVLGRPCFNEEGGPRCPRVDCDGSKFIVGTLHKEPAHLMTDVDEDDWSIRP